MAPLPAALLTIPATYFGSAASLLAAALLLVAGLLLVPTLPLTVELLVLSFAAMLRPRPAPAVPSPTDNVPFRLAALVPAHNEAAMIGSCVCSILASTPAAANAVVPTIYVIAHNCSDNTAEQARRAGAHAVELNEPVGGKGLALDFGFRHALAAGADAVVVIDADSVVSPGLLQSMAARFRAGAQALQCRYEVANPAANERTRLATLGFLGINVLRPRGRDRLGLSCGIFGNGFALSAETIRRVPYVANSVVEDLEYHLNLIRAGIRVEFVDEAAVLGEMPTGSAASATQRARWEGGRLLMRRRWTGPLLAEVLRGRLRLLEPLLDLRSQPLATQATLLLPALACTALATWLHLGAWQAAGLGVCLLSLAALLVYVLAAAVLGPEPGQTLRVLLSVPGYLLWKLLLIPRTRMTARRDAAWVRTARNAEVASETLEAAPPTAPAIQADQGVR